MEKQYKKVHGQQFFFVSTLLLFYCDIIVLVALLLTADSNRIQEAVPEALRTIGILTLFLIPIFAVIALILFAISRIWVKPYATLAEQYMIVNDEKIFYFDIQKIELVPCTWLGFRIASHGIPPYGPAEIRLYCKDKRYTRFSEEDYITLEGISYGFFFALKKKCPSATIRYKYLIALFLIVPICIAAVSALIALVPEEYR